MSLVLYNKTEISPTISDTLCARQMAARFSVKTRTRGQHISTARTLVKRPLIRYTSDAQRSNCIKDNAVVILLRLELLTIVTPAVAF